MASAIICARCGQKIVTGGSNRYKSKTYCNGCYDKVMQEQMALELAKEELYNYIKELFGKSECPSEVIYAVEQALLYGKKIKGIQATLYYYYEVAGNQPTSIYFVPKVIKEQYDNARKYMEEVHKVMQANKEVDLNVEPICVKISTPKTKKKPKYRMEDL